MAGGKEMGWKDWVIGALWAATLTLLLLGYNSMISNMNDNSQRLAKVGEAITKHSSEQAQWMIEYERQRAQIWRVIDKICGYQTERLRKEGILPQYAPPADK